MSVIEKYPNPDIAGFEIGNTSLTAVFSAIFFLTVPVMYASKEKSPAALHLRHLANLPKNLKLFLSNM